MAKIANHKIEKHISTLTPFVNYNGTIIAGRNETTYSVYHWSTEILNYNINTGEIVYLMPNSISQTTSTLVGRIVRSLPRQAVVNWLTTNSDVSLYNLKRIARLARIDSVPY
jgi:hypothetical protein